MARVYLSVGTYFVGIKHETELFRYPDGKFDSTKPIRGTKVWIETPMAVSNPPRVIMGAVAKCHEKDNFCKQTGRKIAANRLLAEMRKFGWSKEDRIKVFNAICPEFKA